MKSYSGRVKRTLGGLRSQGLYLAVFLVFSFSVLGPTGGPAPHPVASPVSPSACLASVFALYAPGAALPQQQHLAQKEILMELVSGGLSTSRFTSSASCSTVQGPVSPSGSTTQPVIYHPQAPGSSLADPARSSTPDACRTYAELRANGGADRFFLKDLQAECQLR